MDFFSFTPFPFSYLAFFGAILLLGLIGGEVAKRFKFLPTITGYIAVGYIIGPSGLNLLNDVVLAESRIFIDISIGLILFELGRKLDFTWLRHDPNLLFMSLAECTLTFIIVMLVMKMLGMAWLASAITGSIAVITSPAVVMMVAHDLFSEGPVTRRALLLTSLNNLFGLSVFIILLPFIASIGAKTSSFFNFYISKFVFSFILGTLMFFITKLIAIFVGKRKDTQFVLLVSMTLLTIGLAHVLNFSMMMSLFIFGIASRNLDKKHSLTEIDFELLARISFILLFVITGVQLHLKGLMIAGASVIAFILARSFAKTLGICLLARSSRLTKQQTFALSLALTPMAGIALGLSHTLTNFNQEFGYLLTSIIISAVTILNIIGPIATQYAFISTGEAITKTNAKEKIK